MMLLLVRSEEQIQEEDSSLWQKKITSFETKSAFSSKGLPAPEGLLQQLGTLKYLDWT